MPIALPTSTDSPTTIRDAALQRLPESLYAAVVTGTSHNLNQRISGVCELRAALLKGCVPATKLLPWPVAPFGERLLAWLDESGLPRYCRDNADLTDAVILSIIDEATHATARVPATTEKVFQELLAVEKQRSEQEPEAGVGSARTPAPDPTPSQISRLRNQAAAKAIEKTSQEAQATLASAWGERLRVWAAIEGVFGEIGVLCGLGWDLSRSVLQHVGWSEMKRLAELIGKLPKLQEIIRSLGRMQSKDSDEESSILERILGRVRRAPAELRDMETPLAPHETRGVERSGDISRMLPSEAALFNRPVLRLLWHAKRAERALMTYRVEGVGQDQFTPDALGVEARDALREARKQKHERGPIIVCLDTSGSMKGAPETVAKAITLETVRIASAEGRTCYLYSFSGPRDIAEFDLSPQRGGIKGLLEFLACSFHGGTDVAEPVARAIKRVQSEEWANADIILVSDGEFLVPEETRRAIVAAKQHSNLRVHGLVIGSERSAAMAALCDPLHKFRDWETVGYGGSV